MKTVKKEVYILMIAKNLASNRKKIDALGSKDTSQMTQKRRGAHESDLTWECMNRSMNEERLRFAMGDLKPENCLEYYEPSAFHKYKGVREELSNLNLV